MKLDRPFDFERYAATFRDAPIELVLRKRRSKRSDKQNRAYFGIVVAMMAEHCGYTTEEMHEALAWKFLGCTDEGDPLPRRRSTADLNTVEMEEYQAKIRRFAAEDLGLSIPEPNEVDA